MSFHLFETYIAAVFQRLGLEPMHGESVRIPDSLNHYLGAEWWRRGRLEIILGANVTSRFKKAFLNLGIIFKEDMPNEVNFENDPPKVVSVVYEPKEKNHTNIIPNFIFRARDWRIKKPKHRRIYT